LTNWVQERIKGGDEVFQQSITEEALKEQQKIRSERAKKAYQTRLENKRLKEEEIKKSKKTKPKKQNKKSYAEALSNLISSSVENQSPQNSKNMIKIKRKESMIQIEKCLDNGELPSSLDVQTIISPIRLAGRRPLLLRILKDCFGLYGKCIPGDPSLGAESKMLFASTCNLDVLGTFVLDKLEEKEIPGSTL